VTLPWALERVELGVNLYEVRIGGTVRKFAELSYANASDSWLKQQVIRKLEDISGRNEIVPYYESWQRSIGPKPEAALNSLLDLIKVDLIFESGALPERLDPAVPLVIVANHPYGILDGIAASAVAERLGRPFKVLINNDLLKVPEAKKYGLAVDFSPTRQAQESNIATKREALRLLKSGTVIIVFPAGGIATAPSAFGVAAELPWKTFTSRMIQEAHASVLPIFFEGQCRPLFHLVSRYSPTLRLSMIIGEFKRQIGSELRLHVGDIVPFEKLANPKDRIALTNELFEMVHKLSGRDAPSQDGLPEWLAPKKAG
jgi:putative hemolysin